MKNFFISKVWPIVAGLLTAFIIMMVFEYINSRIFPFPVGMDTANIEALRAFTDTLPWTAYILVFLGWIVGSFKAGCVTTHLSKERTYRLSFGIGIFLTLLGVLNNTMIGSPIFFTVISLPVFILFTYLGHRYILKTKATL